jgi:hypothetical protein
MNKSMQAEKRVCECGNSLRFVPGDDAHPPEWVCDTCGLVYDAEDNDAFSIVPEASPIAPMNDAMFGRNLGSFGRTRDEATLLAVRSVLTTLMVCPKCNHKWRVQIADPETFKAHLITLKKFQIPEEHPSMKRALEILKAHSEALGLDPEVWAAVGTMVRRMIFEATRLSESQIIGIVNLALMVHNLPAIEKKGR